MKKDVRIKSFTVIYFVEYEQKNEYKNNNEIVQHMLTNYVCKHSRYLQYEQENKCPHNGGLFVFKFSLELAPLTHKH